jgi:hypothetical protein
MKNNSQIEKKEQRLARPLKVLVPLIKKDLAKIERITESATYEWQVACGGKLAEAKSQVRSEWKTWLQFNFALSYSTAMRYISAWESRKKKRDLTSKSITEHLRNLNPNYALPRQKVDEPSARSIWDGIDTEVFEERQVSSIKERRLKVKMAVELVEAGFRAMSHKLHTDKGGSDDAMRRLDEVRKTLKQAINSNEIAF